METLAEVEIILESETEKELKDAMAEPVIQPKVSPKPEAGQKVFSPALRALLEA